MALLKMSKVSKRNGMADLLLVTFLINRTRKIPEVTDKGRHGSGLYQSSGSE
jgi:hypothetical protein